MPSAVAVTVVGFMSMYLTANICDAYKILLVPSNMNSHVMFFSRLAVDLSKLGHVATVLATSGAHVPDFATDNVENFTYLQYPMNETTPFANSREASETMVAMALTTSILRRIRMLGEFGTEVTRHGEGDCMQLLDNVGIMNRVRQTGFEFAIMDITATVGCYYTIPYSLGIPYATLSIPVSSAHLFRVPRLAVFPNMVSLNDRPTFFERMKTLIAMRVFGVALMSDSAYYMKKYVPNRPSLDTVELFRRQSLWFFIENLSLNYPLPQMPNTIAVGDIMIGAQKRPLSDEIQRFISKSKPGVIIASFGSYCDFFPPKITQRICNAFTEVAKRFEVSIIWKLIDEGLCVNENILILPWIPQNDLLADSRVKLFISHGGHNSLMESIYHAKPLVVFPIALDQPANAAAAESKGFAIQMNIADFTTEMLVSNIKKLLTDSTYKRNVELASAILRDRRDTPAQRVSAMIDHVIKYGDQHLRTGAFEMSTLQFLMFDIFAALFVSAVVVLSSAVLCCYCAYMRCCSRSFHSTSAHRKLKSQ